jgi:hypothetical protein
MRIVALGDSITSGFPYPASLPGAAERRCVGLEVLIGGCRATTGTAGWRLFPGGGAEKPSNAILFGGAKISSLQTAAERFTGHLTEMVSHAARAESPLSWFFPHCAYRKTSRGCKSSGNGCGLSPGRGGCYCWTFTHLYAPPPGG